MYSKYSFMFLILNIFVFCESKFVDSLIKCKIGDGDCEKKLLQNAMLYLAEEGAPEIGIAPIDPMELHNVTVNILDFVDITLIEGYAKGIKNCVIIRFQKYLEDGRGYLDVICDITIKGKYSLYSESPMIKSLLNGNTIRGNGKGKVKIEKVKFSIQFNFYPEKRDGEYYLTIRPNKTKYDFEVQGKMLFYADNIYVGNVESSKSFIELMNSNWRFILQSFGKPFMDKAMDLLFSVLDKIFKGIPAKHYLLADLTPYVKE